MSNEEKKSNEAKASGFSAFGGFGAAAKGFGGLGSFGQSLREKAVELGEKATSQVSELNAKVMTSNIAATIPKTEESESVSTSDALTKSPDNVSKEELLDILQKMNKKVRALTSQRTQLAERCKAAEADKSRLLAMVQEEILNGDVSLEEGKDQIDQLLVAWRAVDERNSFALQELQSEYKKVAMQVQGNVAKVKEAAEKESDAKAEGIRAEAVAEAMANGNVAWEEMRQQMVLRQREESAMLRQQLHEQYDLQLAQQEEDFRLKLHKELENARTEIASKMLETPSSNEDVEALKTQHQEDMNKLKAAAAAQINTFKKKVATARTAELEKLRTKYHDDAAADLSIKLDELKKAHQIEIETLRAQLKVDAPGLAQKELEMLKEQAQRTEMELKQSHKDELERIRSDILQTANSSHLEQLSSLREKYETDLQQVKEEAEIYRLQGIEQTRLELSQQLSKETEERLKVQEEAHREEMDRILSVSSNQMATLERETESSAESIAASEAALQSTKAEITVLKSAHFQELESIHAQHLLEKSSLETKIRKEVEEDHQQLLRDVKNSTESDAQKKFDEAIAAHREELAKRLIDAAADKEMLRTEMEQNLNEKLREAYDLAASKTTEEVTSVQKELEASITKHRQEIEDARNVEIQKLRQEAESVSTRALDLETEAQQKLVDAIASHNRELENVRNDAATTIEKLKEEMEQSFAQKMLDASLVAASNTADEIASVRKILEKEFDLQRLELENCKEAEIQRLKEEAEVLSSRATSLSEAIGEAQKNADETIAAQRQKFAKVLGDTESEKARLKVEMEVIMNEKLLECSQLAASKAAEDVALVRAELESTIANQREEMENDKNAEIRKVMEESDAASARALEQAAETASLKLEELRSDLSQQISENQNSAHQLAQSQRQQELLQGELQDIVAKAAAAEQDKAAILAAAKDGEESSGKELEQALEQQRASFEEQTRTIKGRFTKEIQELENKIHEALEARNSTESNLANASQELTSLRAALSLVEQQLQKSSESTKKAEEERQDEIFRMKQSELAHFSQQMAEVHEDYKVKLLEAHALTAEEARKASALQASLETVRKEHESELKSIKDDFTKQLSDSKEMIEARGAEALGLSSRLMDAEEEHSSLRAKHEELTLTLSNLQQHVSSSASQSTTQMETLVAEKERIASELSTSLEKLEEMKMQHRAELATLTSELTACQDELAEQTREFQATQKDMAILRQKVEDSERSIATITASQNDALTALQHKMQLDQSASADQLVEKVRQELVAEKNVEIEAVKAEYDGKIETLGNKNNAAVELLKKMKAATAQKIRAITNERDESLARLQKENEELTAQLSDEIDNAQQSLSTVREALEQQMKSLSETHEAEMTTLRAETSAAIETIRRDYEGQLAALREEQMHAEEKITERATMMSNYAQTELIERLRIMEENHQKALKEMQNDKQESLSEAISAKEEAVRAVLANYEGALAKSEAEKVALQEKAHDDLTAQLKAQSDHSAAQVEGLTKAMEAHTHKLQKHFQEKMTAAEAEHTKKVLELENNLMAREEQLAKLVGQVKASTAETSSLRDEKDSIHNKLKSEAVVQQALRKKLDEMHKALSESQSSSASTALSLTQIKEELEKEKAVLQDQVKAASQERNAAKNKVEELSGKLSALGANLSAMLDEKKELDQRLQQATKEGAKLRSTESELASLRDQVNTLKLEQTKNHSLLEKLHAEKEASEQKHGQRTALAGMLEEQLAELNEKNADTNAKLEAALYDLSTKDETILSMQEQLDNTEKALADAQNASKKANENLTVAQRGADAKRAKMLDQLQREVQSLQQQMSRKSAAAQRLIQEREAECIELRKQNKFLSQEVDKGSLSDRRIFELAAQQSNRESVASAEIDIRDKVVERLTEKLVAKDGDLASAEYQVNQIDSQVAELYRVRRREDVNLDYLKSIVVQYLSKPPGSTERGALLPVLATLLQFDDNDYKTIEEGKSKLSWWGTVAPIFIEAPSPAPPTVRMPVEQMSPLLGGGSAEVTIKGTPNGRPKTSLEF